MEAKLCGYVWYTGVTKRVKHDCGQPAGHVDDHVCSGKLCTIKTDNDAQIAEKEVVVADETSISDTHILKEDRGFGVQLALCGAKSQKLFKRSRGCTFAPAPEAATCPTCRKMAGLA